MPTNDPIGQGLAGALIATATFKALVQNGTLRPEEALAIIDNAIGAVRTSVVAEERAAFDILKDMRRQLQS